MNLREARRPNECERTPPTGAPAMLPMPKAPPNSPIVRPRSSGLAIDSRYPYRAVNRTAEPIPVQNRESTARLKVGANALPRDGTLTTH